MLNRKPGRPGIVFSILIPPLILWIGYLIWSQGGRMLPLPETRSETSQAIVASGFTSENNRVILGVQPWMTPEDFSSEKAYQIKLQRYLEEARTLGLLTDSTVVVFPEAIGTFLFLVGEKARVFSMSTVQNAVRLMVASNLGKLLSQIPTTQGEDILLDAVIRMKAPVMAATYQKTFAALASRFQVTIIAGSILLPNPVIQQNNLITRQGFLYNNAYIFNPDGKIGTGFAKKSVPGAGESLLIPTGSIYGMPILATEMGKIAVLVGTDAWFTEPYELAKEKGVDTLIVPASYFRSDSSQLPWLGGAPETEGSFPVSKTSLLTPKGKWQRDHVLERFALSDAESMVIVFLNGRFWDKELTGQSIMVSDKTFKQVPSGIDEAYLYLTH